MILQDSRAFKIFLRLAINLNKYTSEAVDSVILFMYMDLHLNHYFITTSVRNACT